MFAFDFSRTGERKTLLCSRFCFHLRHLLDDFFVLFLTFSLLGVQRYEKKMKITNFPLKHKK